MILLLTILLGIIDGTMDTVKFHYSRSVFKVTPDTKFKIWWDSWSNEQSWKNQYVNYPDDKRRRLIGYGPLIWLCDFWHFLKSLLVITTGGVVYYSSTIIIGTEWYYVIGFIALFWFLYGLAHDIIFEVLLKKNYIFNQ